jgi:hypothetical protein
LSGEFGSLATFAVRQVRKVKEGTIQNAITEVMDLKMRWEQLATAVGVEMAELQKIKKGASEQLASLEALRWKARVTAAALVVPGVAVSAAVIWGSAGTAAPLEIAGLTATVAGIAASQIEGAPKAVQALRYSSAIGIAIAQAQAVLAEADAAVLFCGQAQDDVKNLIARLQSIQECCVEVSNLCEDCSNAMRNCQTHWNSLHANHNLQDRKDKTHAQIILDFLSELLILTADDVQVWNDKASDFTSEYTTMCGDLTVLSSIRRKTSQEGFAVELRKLRQAAMQQ